VVALPTPVLEKNMRKARKGEEDDRLPLTYRENEIEEGKSEAGEEECEA
jgi:hypothetical protein